MKRISLWSGPRNVSTALMYSFAQRDDTRVVDEPLYACYLTASEVEHPGKEKVLEAQSSDPKEVIENVILGDVGRPVLFMKNMAHHMAGIDPSFLKELVNPFLIRNPREMLPSLIKTIPDPVMRDTAYKKQFELFRYVTDTLGQPPVVIDAKELLIDPAAVLARLCDLVGIEYDATMLRWEKGPRPEDGVWAGHWYDSVHESTGFRPYRPKKEPVPDRLAGLLDECLHYYNELRTYAITANDN